ncbi:MAG: DUF1501 domain-containing protein [Akkermansiaceae bacterium]|nr:DUF1501 domain-containing protein [Akkermansiaceae bacterium]MCP5551246.1 DUF1501 domain-containing protein [Akkermansiaceae bacterium]
MNGIPTPADRSRREFLLRSGACGFGYLAFRGLAAEAMARETAGSDESPLAPRRSHFPARAKRVIFLFMRGGPSQVDSFDWKPELTKRHDEDLGGGRRYFQSPWEFARHGECGMPISSLFPNIARHADDLCVINSMHTDIGNHPQAILQMNTGSFQFVRPSVGSWVVYGLGTENQNLPGFITINPDFSAGGARKYGCAFLPSPTAGTAINQWGGGDSGGPPSLKGIKIPYTENTAITPAQQRRQLDLIQSLNRHRLDRDGVNESLEGVIQSYETAFRMQTEMPELMDVEREPAHILERYGVGKEPTDNYGRACLMARRFVENGVRFVQINQGFWDQHTQIVEGHGKLAAESDQPIAALLTDLKERGLLEDTLVLWGGEFGRPPILNKNGGRDHNNVGFTMWLAGGGTRGGLRYGETDPTGQTAEVDKVHLHDLHATLLHLLGLDHERLTYRYGGRDFRLTDIHGQVVKGILA